MKLGKMILVVCLAMVGAFFLTQLGIQLWGGEGDSVVATDPETRPPAPLISVVIVVDHEPRPAPVPPVPVPPAPVPPVPVTVVIVVNREPMAKSQAPAPAPPVPVVVKGPFIRTENVLWVSSTSAELIGFVDPKGQIVAIWLEYGEGSSLDRRTDEISVNSTTSLVRRILGLSPGTRYSFRTVVRQIDGRVFHGNTRTFMTDR